MIERHEQLGLRGAWIIAITAPLAAARLAVPLRTPTQKPATWQERRWVANGRLKPPSHPGVADC
jgi:hypothetical protein